MGKDPVITAVTVTNEPSIIVDIMGSNFTLGNAAPVVVLGGNVMTVDGGTLVDAFESALLLVNWRNWTLIVLKLKT